jgi:hypothetical protein
MLTDSKSIERGFGPDCWKLIQCWCCNVTI